MALVVGYQPLPPLVAPTTAGGPRGHPVLQSLYLLAPRQWTHLSFWVDHWLDGQSITEIAPALVALVPNEYRHYRTVYQALSRHVWIQDIQRALGPAATVKYVDLWRWLQQVMLTPLPNMIRWRSTDNESTPWDPATRLCSLAPLPLPNGV